MPATSVWLHPAALLGYVSLAVLFAWPLPREMGTALFGSPGGDTGVYVWNLWVFRHELVSHGAYPFVTAEILNATPAVPLTLHNYTPAANLVALPLLPLLGSVGTFNLLILASSVLSAYVMFLLLRALVGDNAAAWLGGVLYGFSPFILARQMAHFSLVQAAALPACALILHRLGAEGPTRGRAAALGAVLAWAFLSDPYYAVYGAMMVAFFVGWQAVAISRRPRQAHVALRVALDVGIVAAAAVVLAIAAGGGRALDVGGLRVSVRSLYTPALVLTILGIARAWIAARPQVTVDLAPIARLARVGGLAACVCLALLAPILLAIARHAGEGQWIAPPVFWRSSAPGVDLLALVAPNPVGTFTGWVAAGWLRAMPDGLYENVASVPWTVLLTVAGAVAYAGLRLPRYWVVFTGAAAVLALGPFVTVGGWNTHIPAPWALLRYLPVVGAARMPTRLTVLVMLGASVLLAYAVRAWRVRTPRRTVPALAVGALLILELLPAPRTLHRAHVPGFLRLIAADRRPVSVMHLPFGLRDGLSSTGDFSAHAQFWQTFHEKPLVGGYLSRLPRDEVLRYRRLPLLDVLLDLSEGREVAPERLEAARWSYADGAELNIGYVIVDMRRASAELAAFAGAAMRLEHVETDGAQALYIVR